MKKKSFVTKDHNIFNFRVSNWMNEKVEEVAERYGITKSDIIRTALVEYLRKHVRRK